MRQLTGAILIAVFTTVAMVCAAFGESSTIGVLITSDRDPGDFADPKSTKYELNGAHTFDSGLILGGSFQYNDRAFSDRARENLEGTVGYRVPLYQCFSIFGSAGLGEHWRQNPSAAFPYYVLRIGADLDLNQIVTWNAITFRYRNAFDPNDNYNTPQLATGFTFKLDEQRAITTKIMRNWRDGAPSSTGVALGFKQSF
jgi:hypothetical protein